MRRALAVYGRLASFNLVNKPEFQTNIAFASFVNPAHAKHAFSSVTFAATHLGNFSVYWHRPKNISRQKQTLINEISQQVSKLELYNLKADPSSATLGNLSPEDLEQLKLSFNILQSSLKYEATEPHEIEIKQKMLRENLTTLLMVATDGRAVKGKVEQLVGDVGTLERVS